MKDKRLLLVEPPYYRLFGNRYSCDRYPNALGYLAGTVAERTDWKVMAYNADFHPHGRTSVSNAFLFGSGYRNYVHALRTRSHAVWDEVRRTISSYNPSVIGITVRSQNLASALIVARMAKEHDPSVLVIAGGPHPSSAAETVLCHADIDIAVRGEGEDALCEILAAYENGAGWRSITGIASRERGAVIMHAPRAACQDLDPLCFPHAHAAQVLKDYALYPALAFRSIFASRGCPYDCFFCGSRSVWGRQVRYRSVHNVVQQMRALRDAGVNVIHINDDNFGADAQYADDLCEQLATEHPQFRWSCELSVRLVTRERIAAMRRAGCVLVCLGVESGNNEMLARLRKGFTCEQAMSAAELIRGSGMELLTFYMIGSPWETDHSLDETVAAMRRMPSDIIVYNIFTPYPGTEAFDFCRDHGLLKEPYESSLFNHQGPENAFCLHMPRDHFRQRAGEIARLVDRLNARKTVRRIFSRHAYARVRDVGWRRVLSDAVRVAGEMISSLWSPLKE